MACSWVMDTRKRLFEIPVQWASAKWRLAF